MKEPNGQRENAQRRPDLYIVARFLERLWLDGKEYRRLSLQAAVGVNYTLFTWYFTWLQNKGLITVKAENGQETVLITQKGVDAYHTFVAWVLETVGDIGPKKRRK